MHVKVLCIILYHSHWSPSTHPDWIFNIVGGSYTGTQIETATITGMHSYVGLFISHNNTMAYPHERRCSP